jgi:hypothetical protein
MFACLHAHHYVSTDSQRCHAHPVPTCSSLDRSFAPGICTQACAQREREREREIHVLHLQDILAANAAMVHIQKAIALLRPLPEPYRSVNACHACTYVHVHDVRV